MGVSSGSLVVDLRAFDPEHRRTVVFGLVDMIVQLGCGDQLVLVTEHEPAGLGYQIDLRRETRGKFEFSYDRRSDGAWVALVKPKKQSSE